MSLSCRFLHIEAKKLKSPANDENLARKLTFSIENNFMMQTQIDYFYGVMLTDAQVYCMTSMIYLFRLPLTAKAVYRKTAEAKLYT